MWELIITNNNYVGKAILFLSRNCITTTATGEREFEITGGKHLQFNRNFIFKVIVR